MELITIYTFENSVEAHLLKSKLESEDIPCFLFDENISTVMPLYSLATGGIKLKVRQEHFEIAEGITQAYLSQPLIDENEEILKCPRCKSSNLYYGFKSFKGLAGIVSIAISFLMMIYPVHLNTVKRCKDCGTEFK